MKITMYSNFLNHHQLPFAQAMCERCDFHFVAGQPLAQEQKQLGYHDMNQQPFVVRAYEPEGQRLAEQLMQDSDVVLAGNWPITQLTDRLNQGKLTFWIAERLYKHGRWTRLHPHYQRYVNALRPFQNAPFYLLAIGTYAAEDFALSGLFRDKAFRWGYFPAEASLSPTIDKPSDPPRLLWGGRMLGWKHPEDVLWAAKRLREDGAEFRLDMIGDGRLRPALESKAKRYGLQERCAFPGSMSPEAVRDYMKRASILVLSSDAREGWGAVLNEAMAEGCAVVGSHAAGASQELIRSGKNGLLYPSGDRTALYRQIKSLLQDDEQRSQLGAQARETIAEHWNGRVAAERLLALSEHLLCGKTGSPFAEGIASCAI